MLRVAIIRSLVITLIAALGLLFFQPAGAGAATTLTLSPSSGGAGTLVTVTGSGYSNGSQALSVTIYFNGTAVATTTSSNSGVISTSFTVPAVAPGNYTVTAASTFAATNAPFVVTSNPASISVSPTSGPPGTVVTLSGSGFGANQTATVSFNGVSGGSFTTTSTGTIPTGTSFVVPNVGSGTYTVRVSTSTQTATASFTVGAGTGALVAAKFVTVNGLGYSTVGSARPGDTLTYQLQFTNNTGNSLSVVATDVVAGGQTILVTPGFPCSFAGTSTLSCPVTVPSGSSASVFFSTVVNSGFTGTITNQASATSTVTGTTTAGPSATTNATVVSVGTVVPVTASLELCGVVTAFNPATSTSNGSLTISGVTVVIAAGSTMTNVVAGTNECVLANVNGSGQLTTVAGASNLSGVSVACGVYTTAASGFVNVGGIPLVVGPGTNFVGGLVAGASYCFILNASGQAIGAVAGIPTRAIFPTRHHPYWWERVRTIEM